MKKIEQINKTTYKTTPNDNEFERFEIEIGDSKQPDFKPQVKLMKWTNECNFSVRAIDDEVGNFKQVKDKEKIKLVKNKREYHFYEDGENFEFEVILKEKPKTNVVKMSIQTKGLKFYYQPELTEEEKKTCTRPENVVGSYAVYHESKQGDYHLMGKKNYRAGKAFHIYRPKIVDKTGNWTWGELNINEKKGILTVEIPQEFLDNAVYPVIVDPTFGYTSKGSTFRTSDDIDGGDHPLPENGIISSISVWLYRSSATKCKCAIYNTDYQKQGVSEEKEQIYNPASETTFNFSPTINLNSGTYWLVKWSDKDTTLYMDTGSRSELYHIYPDYDGYPDSFTPDYIYNDYITSIYATYTAGDSGYTSPFPAFKRP